MQYARGRQQRGNASVGYARDALQQQAFEPWTRGCQVLQRRVGQAEAAR